MINYGVAGALSAWSATSGSGSAATTQLSGVGAKQFFGNVEANNFSVGIDFAY
jgi:hypothetical protein